ncbi:coatomer protein complex [Planoprotostelium fungivorum]|uniref:Coatomer subunit alpha n=1 Tax=Planoprotostelium fungivorum TaxID=1890364 RepID=A0A2P6MPH4_9EUKA|nr:coatomer protein complex [Planoprotostelium fungivorum]
MLIKLETKSNRVKGLSFHPTRPWVLASLHNGVIQLYDYRIRTLVDKFEEHDGPVRGLDFHSTQPLFVSGGDDYKIKVWNYKQRRCLYPLLGHLDYIRTVQFHLEHPWILSSSDDQTIRIWNWQSKTCVAVLTGHNHYVMCAAFHPTDDLVVSASLDQTVRVWDISGLRKKNVSGPGTSSNSYEDNRLAQNDLFGNADALVKYVLEGHERGVNWVAFHKTAPLIVSGADDRQIKLWRMNESRAWEVDSFRGHFNNVSCVLFHPKQDLILSDSEDKTVRVWDTNKRSGIQTFRREHDRFWILAAHPENNFFAAGHDSGMLVFKLERERPAFASHQGENMFYVKDRLVQEFNYNSNKEFPRFSIKARSGLHARTKSLVYSPENNAIILTSDVDGGIYELYMLPKEKAENYEPKKGMGTSVAFLGMKRFAVLDKTHQISIRDFMNEEVKRITPGGNIDRIFSAPNGLILLQGDEKVILYDIQAKRSLGDMTTPEVKYVHWSTGKNPQVAMISEDTLIIATRNLEQLCSIHESVRIKSGAWDDSGVFIYSTSTHIKYCLPNGDNGIIRTLDSPMYIHSIKNERVYLLDRECKLRVISIDTTEYVFKYALIQRQYSAVLRMVKEYNLIGQAIISYLQRKGFPEVALYFVKDEATRFNLALESGNIEIALESAKIINNEDSWNRLGTEALRQGNHQIVEMAYQRTKNYDKLSFLYLITGNMEKLKKMAKHAEIRNDVMSRFHNSLYLGDVRERIRILEEVGQLPLALASATVHDVQDSIDSISAKLNTTHPDLQIPTLKQTGLLFPPLPLTRGHESNWPLLNVTKGYFDSTETRQEETGHRDVVKKSNLTADDLGEASGWGDEIENSDDETAKKPAKRSEVEEEETGETEEPSEWAIDELELSDDEPEVKSSKKTPQSSAILPQPGPSHNQTWSNSNFAADHVAAGSFDTAFQLLNQQIGAVNFAPLKSLFLQMAGSSMATLPSLASIPSQVTALTRTEPGPNSLPLLFTSIEPLIDTRLKLAYKSTFGGKFQEALNQFTNILHQLTLFVASTRKEATEAKELINICREHILGLRLELARKEVGASDVARQIELAAYFTHCKLEVNILRLALKSAMSQTFKLKNFQHAASFARRLLELEPPEDVEKIARKVVQSSEKENTNAVKVQYNEKNPFAICGATLTPIYKGTPHLNCSFCATSFLEEKRGTLCPVCNIASVGAEASGILFIQETKKSKATKKKVVVEEEEDDDDAW